MHRAEHAPPEESAPEGLRAIFLPVVRKFGEVSHELGDGIKDVGEAWKARVEDVVGLLGPLAELPLVTIAVTRTHHLLPVTATVPHLKCSDLRKVCEIPPG